MFTPHRLLRAIIELPFCPARRAGDLAGVERPDSRLQLQSAPAGLAHSQRGDYFVGFARGVSAGAGLNRGRALDARAFAGSAWRRDAGNVTSAFPVGWAIGGHRGIDPGCARPGESGLDSSSSFLSAEIEEWSC